MKEKIIIIFSCLIINIIFINNEVLPYDEIIKENNNITNNYSLTYASNNNETEFAYYLEKNQTYNSVKKGEIDNNISFINQTQENINQSSIVADIPTLNNEGNITEKNQIKENRILEASETNQNNQSSLNETYEKNLSSIINETSKTIIDNISLESSKENSSLIYQDEIQTNNIEKGKAPKDNNNEININNNNDQLKEKLTQKDFNLTEEIEKLYYNRLNETSSNLQEDYEEDHNAEYYENMEEVKVNEEHEKKSQIEREEEAQMRKEWEQQVSNFTAQDLLTIKLKKYSTYKFYEEILVTSALTRVAYFVNQEFKKINFEILEPSGNPIFIQKNKGQSYYEFRAPKAGFYKFILTNHDSLESIKVSFALHTGENIDSHLKNTHLDDFTKKIKKVGKKLGKLKFTHNILNKKYDGHRSTTLINNFRIGFYSIIETSLMSIILIVQLFYLKSLIKDY